MADDRVQLSHRIREEIAALRRALDLRRSAARPLAASIVAAYANTIDRHYDRLEELSSGTAAEATPEP
jgi:hypothetical protein